MASNSASGHNGNLNAFNELIKACTTLGSIYNPSAPALGIQNMTMLHDRGKAAQSALINAETEYKAALNARSTAFDKLDTALISIRSIFESNCDDPKNQSQFDTIYRKLKGRRATEIEKPENVIADPNLPEKKHISTAQTGFDDTLLNFEKTISLLRITANYQPNETEYTVEGLSQQLETLTGLNDDAKQAYTNYTEALNNRDFIFYTPINGIVDTGRRAKKYVKGILKPGNALYKEFTKFEFRTYKTDELIEIPVDNTDGPQL